MVCYICQKTSDEARIFRGIYEGEVVDVCEDCVELEKIPVIKRATEEQIKKSEHSASVRERMENLSGITKGIVSKEHSIALRNLSKIKVPQKEQQPENLVPNYHWEIKIARRRLKMTPTQLSERTCFPQKIIEQIERGQPPKDYEAVMLALEAVLEIRLFRDHPKKLIFHLPDKSPEKKQQQILEQTMDKIKEKDKELIKAEKQKKIQEKKKVAQEITQGKFDFSRKQNLENLTLNDLVELKRKKDKLKEIEKKEQEHEELFGDDVGIEPEEN